MCSWFITRKINIAKDSHLTKLNKRREVGGEMKLDTNFIEGSTNKSNNTEKF